MNGCKVYLKKGKEESLLRFHPWVFSGAVAFIEGEPAEGDVVEVYIPLPSVLPLRERDTSFNSYIKESSKGECRNIATSKGEFIGVGHYQVGSIAVRILSFTPVEIDVSFWAERIRQAWQLRQSLGLVAGGANNIYRLINGEGDSLPGLIIDIYAKTAVIQAHSAGMHRARHDIAKALLEVFGCDIHRVFYKSEGTLPFRANLGEENEYLFNNDKDAPPIAIENGMIFQIDWLRGQKTGYYIDQRDNRDLLKKYANNRSVLNMFCYTGGFSVYALKGGATLVHSVDSSAKAISITNDNVALNFPGDSRHQAFTDDAFHYLENIVGQYDLIVLDPPAFAKHKNVVRNALQGYRKLNAIAIKNIREGGLIFTFSCSQIVSKNDFRLAVFSAAAQAGRSVRILHQMTQPADHPINIYHPEGEYLKGLVLMVSG